MKLFLLPNVLSSFCEDTFDYLPLATQKAVQQLDGLIAESEKEGRRYLKRFTYPEGKTFRDVPIHVLNEHTKKEELSTLVSPMVQGQIWGLISDAGLPCLADPGSALVALSRQKGVAIEVISGPSSIIQALLLSGLPAQRFSFRGYVSKEPSVCCKELLAWEQESSQKKMTQICMDAPYRSTSLLHHLLGTLADTTVLSVCSDLCGESPYVDTKSVAIWKKTGERDLEKKPTVFLFFAN